MYVVLIKIQTDIFYCLQRFRCNFKLSADPPSPGLRISVRLLSFRRLLLGLASRIKYLKLKRSNAFKSINTLASD